MCVIIVANSRDLFLLYENGIAKTFVMIGIIDNNRFINLFISCIIDFIDLIKYLFCMYLNLVPTSPLLTTNKLSLQSLIEIFYKLSFVILRLQVANIIFTFCSVCVQFRSLLGTRVSFIDHNRYFFFS